MLLSQLNIYSIETQLVSILKFYYASYMMIKLTQNNNNTHHITYLNIKYEYANALYTYIVNDILKSDPTFYVFCFIGIRFNIIQYKIL